MPTKKVKSNKKRRLSALHWQWGMMCSLSSLDQERNNISMFNIIDQLNVSSTFFAHDKQSISLSLPHELIIAWRRVLPVTLDDSDFEGDVVVELIDPEERVLHSVTMPIILRATVRRTRQRIDMQGVPITVPGDYCYRIRLVEGATGEESDSNAIFFEVISV